MLTDKMVEAALNTRQRAVMLDLTKSAIFEGTTAILMVNGLICLRRKWLFWGDKQLTYTRKGRRIRNLLGCRHETK